MIKNEASILGAFVDQLNEFFDYHFIVDHQSTDSSKNIVNELSTGKLSTYTLLSNGYPQSELATFFLKKIFDDTDAEYAFFLDSDEFLPFVDRSKLEAFLNREKGDVIELPWLNLCPQNLDGGNIFSGRFYRGEASNEFSKSIIARSAWEKDPQLIVSQGYHTVLTKHQLTTTRSKNEHLLHIPIRSRVQITLKLVAGHNRLVAEKKLLREHQGSHWKELAQQLRFDASDNFLRNLALNYPDVKEEKSAGSFLKFAFPYVNRAYNEDAEYVSQGIVALLSSEVGADNRSAFTLVSDKGDVVLKSKANRDEAVSSQAPENVGSGLVPSLLDRASFSDLFEPLFNLPAKMPPTAWSGHIPFMFVIFKILKPSSYVELGVHVGASLIAACTAARQYGLETRIYGIDTWEGDEHAGHYAGDSMYDDLRSYLDRFYKNAKLIRSYFADARETFASGSVELLHIDGLHTYEAVREDFTTWLSAMSASGVIMFHDTNVHDRGFGVHRLWSELAKSYRTVEFKHSHGLGVLFLNENDERIAPLMRLADAPEAFGFYRDLVALIAQGVPERMGWQESGEKIAALEAQNSQTIAENAQLRHRNEALVNSTSWRITKPMRALISLFR